MAFDGFGARINDHYEIFPPHHYSPGTLESPAEFTVYCSCEEWSYESMASAGGGVDTNYWPEWEKHLDDVEETE